MVNCGGDVTTREEAESVAKILAHLAPRIPRIVDLLSQRSEAAADAFMRRVTRTANVMSWCVGGADPKEDD